MTIVSSPAHFAQPHGDLRVATQGAGWRVEALDGRSRQIPVREDADVVTRTVFSGFNDARQRVGTAMEHPPKKADPFELNECGGSSCRFRRHGTSVTQQLCHIWGRNESRTIGGALSTRSVSGRGLERLAMICYGIDDIRKIQEARVA